MTWVVDDGDVQLAQGDALDVLRQLPAEIAQTCVTSPPYWSLRDYGTGTWQGGDESCDHQTGKTARNDGNRTEVDGFGGSANRAGHADMGPLLYRDTCAKCGATRHDDQLGLEPTPELYVQRLVDIMREVRRVLRPDGTLWVVLGDSYASAGAGGGGPASSSTLEGTHQSTRGRPRESRPRHGLTGGTQHVDVALGAGLPPGMKPKDMVGIPWMVAFALRADGWYLRSDCIWAKPNPMPESVTDRPTKSHEYVFLLAKRQRYFYDSDAVAEATSRISSGNLQRVDGAGRQAAPGLGEVAASVPWWNDGAGRNLRTVWDLATEPTPQKHFATYPRTLVERCIKAGTSEHGECSSCGTPWLRVTEYEHTPANNGSTATNIEANAAVGITSGQQATRPASGSVGPATAKRQLGWQPQCTCDATPRPQLVLDPFVGSGTTALVARGLGRRCIGIDLSADYLEIAAGRTQQLSLFAGVDAG